MNAIRKFPKSSDENLPRNDEGNLIQILRMTKRVFSTERSERGGDIRSTEVPLAMHVFGQLLENIDVGCVQFLSIMSCMSVEPGKNGKGTLPNSNVVPHLLIFRFGVPNFMQYPSILPMTAKPLVEQAS